LDQLQLTCGTGGRIRLGQIDAMDIRKISGRFPTPPAGKQRYLMTKTAQGPDDFLDVDRTSFRPEYRHTGVGADIGNPHRRHPAARRNATVAARAEKKVRR
jgi:hypothetical protein